MLRQLSRQNQTNSGLDLPSADSALVVHTRQMTSLRHNTLEDIRHERVHHSHSSLGNTAIGMHLLQHTVDVRRVRLQSSSLTMIKVSLRLRSLCTLARSFRHSQYHTDTYYEFYPLSRDFHPRLVHSRFDSFMPMEFHPSRASNQSLFARVESKSDEFKGEEMIGESRIAGFSSLMESGKSEMVIFVLLNRNGWKRKGWTWQDRWKVAEP